MALMSYLVEEFRAWSKRQYEHSIQQPVIPSQGERWRAMHRAI